MPVLFFWGGGVTVLSRAVRVCWCRLSSTCPTLWSRGSRARSSESSSWSPPTASPRSCPCVSCTGEPSLFYNMSFSTGRGRSKMLGRLLGRPVFHAVVCRIATAAKMSCRAARVKSMWHTWTACLWNCGGLKPFFFVYPPAGG